MRLDAAAALPEDYWGKLRRNDHQAAVEWHPLIDHCADVAACCEALLRETVLGARLAKLAGAPRVSEVVLARLGVLAALHDLGKFNHGFQNKALAPEKQPFVAGHVQEFVALFGAKSAASRRLSETLPLQEWSTWGGEAAFSPLLLASISHHGKPVTTAGTPEERLWLAHRGLDPFAGMRQLVDATRSWFPAAWSSASNELLPTTPAFQHAFAGLVMLADWLGSDTRFFPYAERREDRMPFARQAAARALREAWIHTARARAMLGDARPGFELVSPYPPRPMQAAVASLPTPQSGGMVILEAETGAGKTEAAALHFLRLLQAGQVDGLYFALPTRTAATQLHARLCTVAERAFSDAASRPPVVLAVPGYIQIDGDQAKRLPGFEVLWQDDQRERYRFRGWAAEHPKRYLAGSVVVGTIDQVLLSALMVSHAHMRGTALLRHLLVVDEVHASDVYMTRLLESVLDSHLEAGGSALLMSATLAAQTRQRLLQRRRVETPITLKEAVTTSYPLLTVANGSQRDPAQLFQFIAPGHGESSKHVAVSAAPLIDDTDAIAQQALTAAALGAQVLVLRNTVRACIATQLVVEQQAAARGQSSLLFRCEGVAAPHHSRFAKPDRERLDKAIDAVFGKESPRQRGCVLVATQTVQQSLDIDADLLITDLCPIDVLLQRIGRLHRHARSSRPSGFEQARAVILAPMESDLGAALRPNGEAHGSNGFGSVYADLRVLVTTLRLISKWPNWDLPAMNRLLVENALHSEVLQTLTEELGGTWHAHARYLDGLYYAHRQQANFQLIDRHKTFDQATFPSGALQRRISTRLGEGDRLVELSPQQPSPFGTKVTVLTLPAWMAPASADDDPVDALPHEGGFGFAYGDRRFRYDRFGLQIATSPPAETSHTADPHHAAEEDDA